MDKEEQDKTLCLAENVMSYWPLILIGFGGALGGSWAVLPLLLI